MARPALEVADILRDHGPAWRDANSGHIEPGPIEGDECDRALSHGGARRICRALRERDVRPYGDRVQLVPQPALPEVLGRGVTPMAGRPQAELLPVPYFHVVYTLPSELRDIAYQNKRVV